MNETLEYFRIGVIASTHGIRGAVKVYPTTDDPTRFKDLKEVILKKNKEELVLHPSQVSMQKGMVLVTFKEFDNINLVEPYVKGELYISREDAIPLEDDEFYVSDLMGLTVKTDDGRELGILSDVIPTGSNDVYEVKKSDGTSLLIPATRECIVNVDLLEGLITVHLLPGLEDL